MKNILIIFAILITSLYFFSFEFTFLPGFNTKKILAIIGIPLLLMNLAKSRSLFYNRDFFILLGISLGVSIMAWFSTVYNNTSDYTYVTYFISMLVWLSAAYTVVNLMSAIHKRIDPALICNYLVGVCVLQCCLALLIDFIPQFKSFVNTYIGSMSGMVGTAAIFDERNRLYGIGAAVDVAGTRFAAVELIIAYLCVHLKALSPSKLILYLISFLLIAFIGNMISRTTTVGVILGLAYWGVIFLYFRGRRASLIWKYMGILLLLVLPSVVLLYYNNELMREYIRFGFEGFFSLWENGTWEVHSNEILEGMYRFPDSIKTWLIGDGYFENPMSDPYYTGYAWKGFYMGTDVGYLRFIYYFGLAGLFLFSFFILKVSFSCIKVNYDWRWMFYCLAALNFIIWFKVSTDLFIVFAMFLCITEKDRSVIEQ